MARSPPNGHTILLTDFSLSTNEVLIKSLPYNLDRDLRSVIVVAEWPLAITVDARLGITTLPELVERAKKDKLNYGSFGLGSAPSPVMELFKSQTCMALEHIPYKGVAPVFKALASGRLPSDARTGLVGHRRPKGDTRRRHCRAEPGPQ